MLILGTYSNDKTKAENTKKYQEQLQIIREYEHPDFFGSVFSERGQRRVILAQLLKRSTARDSFYRRSEAISPSE